MSDVYFIKANSRGLGARIAALKKLLEKVDPFSGYRKDEFIPVKVTIGDSPCVYNVSPELVKTIISRIKKAGAKPFLFDTSVIYSGRRQNAVDHLNLAQSKGFSHSKVGAPFIVADGILGNDGREFNLESENIKKIKTPSFVGLLDSLVVISHVTGHIVSGYAGAIKNVAMGMSCRPTKQVQHSSLKPNVIDAKCGACGCCVAICPVGAISMKEKAFIHPKACVGCGECLCACKFDAIYINWHEDPHVFSKKMADVARLILSKFKNSFFLNFALDITKECDCISTKDEEMAAGNIGIFASCDPLSVDKAAADFSERNKKGAFLDNVKGIYRGLFEYAKQKGLGNIEYNLIEV